MAEAKATTHAQLCAMTKAGRTHQHVSSINTYFHDKMHVVAAMAFVGCLKQYERANYRLCYYNNNIIIIIIKETQILR